RALERLTLLGKSDDSTVVDELTKNLRNNDGEVCRFATDTLISKNKNLSEIISNLMEMISVVGDAIAPSGEKWNAEEMRDFAMQKLAALDQLSKPEIIAELKKNLRSFDTEVRQFTIDTFLIDEEKAQPEVVAVLAKNLCSYKEQVRMKAMNTLISLKKMNDPQVVEVLKKNLSNRTKFGDARIFAFEALLQIKPFTSEIRWLLQENMVNDYKLKGELCWLTLELIDAPIKQRITQLENDLANEDVSVRQYSAERLVLVENITDKVMDVIFENTRASSNEVRDGASKTIAYLLELKKIERNEIINLYLNNLLSIYPHVRAHALINLKDMHCDESLISNKYLIYAQKKLDIPLEWIIELRSFNSLTDEIIAYLITLSINESFVVRQLAVDALGNTKQSGEIVISALVARLKDLKEIKLSAIDSLVKLGCSAPSVLSKLKPFLHDQNAEIRYSVAEAFVDLNCDLSIVSDVLDDLIDVILIDSQRALKASVP
ncbi:MAG: HEAT repeat domain-containing protein, partial [Proteobacteria bacterium]|nr:HEAT repeat domain-containing protein [Pseudomonadota bacterium]